MSDNFKKTVNLSRRPLRERDVELVRAPKDRMVEMPEKRKPIYKQQPNKADEIDRLYEGDGAKSKRENASKSKENTEFKKLNRPKNKINSSNPYKVLALLLFIMLIGISYFAFFNKEGTVNEAINLSEEKWVKVELVDGKIYYGLVADQKADPLVVKNVYSNYDKEADANQTDTGGLRLFKQGQEISIIRYQVKTITNLDSMPAVLDAITANENK